MFVDHFCRHPKPPKGARLDTPLQSELYALLPEGRLRDFDTLAGSASLSRDGLDFISPKALRGLLAALVGSGLVLEVSGHRLDSLTR